MNEALGRAETILRAACGHGSAPRSRWRRSRPSASAVRPRSTSNPSPTPTSPPCRQPCGQADIPVVILGKGSNVLVSDQGFPGLVLRLGRGYRWAARDGEDDDRRRRHAAAGVVGRRPASRAVGARVRCRHPRHARRGRQDERGCPCAGRCPTSSRSVEVFRLATGRAESVPAAEAGFAYRRSIAAGGSHRRDRRVARARPRRAAWRSGRSMDEAREWRRADAAARRAELRQRVQEPPRTTTPRRLIEEAGLKGPRVGGVQVSTKHANFIVADPGGPMPTTCAGPDRADPARGARIDSGSTSSPRCS